MRPRGHSQSSDKIKQSIFNLKIPLSQNHTTPMESQIATPVDFSQF